MITSKAGRVLYAALEEYGYLVKIGSVSNGLGWRLHQIQRTWHVKVSCVALVEVPAYGYLMERTVHTLLTPFRMQSEWFYVHMSQPELERLVALAEPLVAARLAHQRASLAAIDARHEARQKRRLSNSARARVRYAGE